MDYHFTDNDSDSEEIVNNADGTPVISNGSISTGDQSESSGDDSGWGDGHFILDGKPDVMPV